MRVIDYFKDKMLFILINLLFFIIFCGIMVSINISIVVIFCIFFIWFVPLTSYMVLEMLKSKKYYDDIYSILETLDKKYLLPEIVEEPDLIEGQIVNDILRIVSKDMHENVKYYKNMQDEYKEYIETWVHEIKTPIASSKLLIENNKNEFSNKINMQICRIENFVEQVLYYSRSEDVSKDYIIKEINLNEIVNSVVKRNVRDFIGKSIKLNLQPINNVIYSDKKWAEFILNQIIGNSIKYSKENDGTISISCEEKDNSVILKIIDNGVGIGERDIKRIFDKGFTGENGRKFGKSTGIGLYLCKNLCNKLGIGLSIESKIDEGTKAILIFPKSDYYNFI